jgi:hypothetical protein
MTSGVPLGGVRLRSGVMASLKVERSVQERSKAKRGVAGEVVGGETGEARDPVKELRRQIHMKRAIFSFVACPVLGGCLLCIARQSEDGGWTVVNGRSVRVYIGFGWRASFIERGLRIMPWRIKYAADHFQYTGSFPGTSFYEAVQKILRGILHGDVDPAASARASYTVLAI